MKENYNININSKDENKTNLGNQIRIKKYENIEREIIYFNPKSILYLSRIQTRGFNSAGFPSFVIFKSINDILYLAYIALFSINLYDLEKNQINTKLEIEIKFVITDLIYHFDYINNRDLIASYSSYRKNLILWNINKMEVVFIIENVNENGYLEASMLFTR